MRPWLNLCAFVVFLIPLTLAWAEKPASAADKGAQLDDQAGKVSIVIPKGQPVKGIHLPFYDLMGRLKMQFDAEIANRTDENLVDMKALKIETFDEKGQRDMLVHFPTATYDLSSSVIKSHDSVEVRRNDFVLTGVGMEFDSKKRSGRVFSKIRMEIFNRSAETALPTPTPKPDVP